MMHSTDDRPGSAPIGLALRLVAAVATLVGGLVHLQLYLDGYKDFPNDNLGRSFLLNVVASVVVAAALFVRRDVVLRVAGIAVVAGTLVAFWMSRRGDGVFGLREQGLNPSPQGGLALVVEIVALVALAATFLPAIGAGDDLEPRIGAGAGAAVVVVALVSGLLWAQEPDEPDVAEQPSTATSGAAPTTTMPPMDTTTMPPMDSTSTPTTDKAKPGKTDPDNTNAPDTTTPRTDAPATDAPATTAPPTEAPGGEVMEITIADFNFDPAELEIPVGTTVRWTNNDSFDHTIVADDGSFESENLGGGDTFEFTFDTAGTFSYICGIHPSMQGTITVT